MRKKNLMAIVLSAVLTVSLGAGSSIRISAETNDVNYNYG